MTVKQFFKSTAFKSLAVLLSIVILAGALLAIFNDLLFVSSEERFARSMKKIYGGNATVKQTVLAADDKAVAVGDATVNQVYLMDDGNYLVQTTGNGGYQGGSITVWVIFACTGSKAGNNLKWNGIERVVYESNNKQSYIDRFSDADYALFASHNAQLLEGKLFDDGITVVKTGASAPLTFGALTTAVNAAVIYFKANILGEEEESLYKFDSWVDLEKSEWTPDLANNKVTYKLVMKKNGPAPSFTVNVTVTNGSITAFSHEGSVASPDSFADSIDPSVLDYSLFIGKTAEQILALVKDDGSKFPKDSGALEDLGLTTGATYSTEVFLYAAAFAAANFDTILYATKFDSWVDAEKSEITADSEAATVTYKLVMKKNGPAPSFTVNVTVTNGSITAFSHEGSVASPDSFADSIDPSVLDYSLFIGKTAEQILALVKDDGSKFPKDSDALEDLGLTTGATYSTEVFLYAAAYAAANYDVYLAKGGTQA